MDVFPRGDSGRSESEENKDSDGNPDPIPPLCASSSEDDKGKGKGVGKGNDPDSEEDSDSGDTDDLATWFNERFEQWRHTRRYYTGKGGGGAPAAAAPPCDRDDHCCGCEMPLGELNGTSYACDCHWDSCTFCHGNCSHSTCLGDDCHWQGVCNCCFDAMWPDDATLCATQQQYGQTTQTEVVQQAERILDPFHEALMEYARLPSYLD
jgi:hypothetical protein